MMSSGYVLMFSIMTVISALWSFNVLNAHDTVNFDTAAYSSSPSPPPPPPPPLPPSSPLNTAVMTTTIQPAIHPALDDLRRLAAMHELRLRVPRTGKLLLYWRYNMVLTYDLPPVLTVGTVHTIRFRNVIDPTAPCNASDFALYFRLSGPVIVAGLPGALADGSCAWDFTFTIDAPGTYVSVAKILGYRLGADFNDTECGITSRTKYRRTDVLEVLHPQKFYDPTKQCCELCTRHPACSAWSTRGRDCHLFRSASGMYSDNTTQQEGWFSGVARKSHLPAPLYLGCGWHFESVPRCLDKGADDCVFSTRTTLNVVPSDGPSVAAPPFRGRWVAFDTACNASRKNVDSTDEYVRGDGECWMRSNLKFMVVRLEAGAGAYLREAYSTHFFTDPAYGGIVQYKWTGPQFNGTDDELGKLLDGVRVCFDGTSLSEYSRSMFQVRTNVTSTCSQPHVVVDTMNVPHLLWHFGNVGIHNTIRAYVKKAVATPDVPRIFMLAGAYSGEREPHDTMTRAQFFNREFMAIYTELMPAVRRVAPIDMFELSMAWTLDSSTQLDGMHFKGPPGKAAILEILERLRRAKRVPHPTRKGDFRLEMM